MSYSSKWSIQYNHAATQLDIFFAGGGGGKGSASKLYQGDW